MVYIFYRYLYCFSRKHWSCSSTLEASGLVEFDQAFMVLKSYTSSDAWPCRASVHLATHITNLCHKEQKTSRHQPNDFILGWTVLKSRTSCIWIHINNWFYLCISKHTHIGCGLFRKSIFAISKDCAIEEGQILTDWMVQLYLESLQQLVWSIMQIIIQITD